MAGRPRAARRAPRRPADRGRIGAPSASRRVAVAVGLAGAALALVVAALLWGAERPSPALFAAILAGPGDATPAGVIFWRLRLPRVCVAAVVGAALGVGGALLQGLMRNPLVDPYLTGASAGASLAVALGALWRVPPAALPAGAFVAALAVSLTATALARTRYGFSAERLIFAGVALSTLCAAVVTLIVLTLPNLGEGAGVLAWLGGGVGGRGWDDLRWAAPYLAVGFAAALAAAPALNALRAGEARAAALGLDRRWAGLAIVATAALLAAAAVSLAGVVGFVGLMTPHAARRLVGGDARRLLPATALCGAATVVAADALARTVAAPVELPLGVLLAFAGVPVFFALAFRRRPGGGEAP